VCCAVLPWEVRKERYELLVDWILTESSVLWSLARPQLVVRLVQLLRQIRDRTLLLRTLVHCAHDPRYDSTDHFLAHNNLAPSNLAERQLVGTPTSCGLVAGYVRRSVLHHCCSLSIDPEAQLHL
jgi:hypothetical protein